MRAQTLNNIITITITIYNNNTGRWKGSSQRTTVCDGQTHAGADAKRAQIGKSYPSIGSPTPSQKLGGKNWEMNALSLEHAPISRNFPHNIPRSEVLSPKAHNSWRHPATDPQTCPDSSQTDTAWEDILYQQCFVFNDIIMILGSVHSACFWRRKRRQLCWKFWKWEMARVKKKSKGQKT